MTNRTPGVITTVLSCAAALCNAKRTILMQLYECCIKFARRVSFNTMLCLLWSLGERPPFWLSWLLAGVDVERVFEIGAWRNDGDISKRAHIKHEWSIRCGLKVVYD